MPTFLHEALIELFRNRPALAGELLEAVLGVELPTYQQARIESGDLPDISPTEYRADAVVVFTADGVPVLAVVVEIQLGRDLDKRWSWPVYLATLRARLRCSSVLLVVCSTSAIATWCSTPIELGHPGWALRPLAIGPDAIPAVTDRRQAIDDPEFTVLSAMAHGTDPNRQDAVFGSLRAALNSIDTNRALTYYDLVVAALPRAASSHLEAIMKLADGRNWEFQSEFARKYFGRGEREGLAKGRAEALLGFLEARGIVVPGPDEKRILDCDDLGQLDEWIQRAATANDLTDLFA